jgi:hypothetical protein
MVNSDSAARAWLEELCHLLDTGGMAHIPPEEIEEMRHAVAWSHRRLGELMALEVSGYALIAVYVLPEELGISDEGGDAPMPLHDSS